MCIALLLTIAQKAVSEPEIVPPTLIQSIEAPYPEFASDLPDSGEVDARLHLDETGNVTRIEIVRATDPRFIEPAETALKQFLFKPARQGATPIPSVVIYHYRFHPTSETEQEGPPSPAPPTSEDAEKSPREADDDMVYETVVRDRRERTTPSRRLQAEEIKRIPGIHGDAVLAIQTLPGVGKPPAMLGALFIRGSDDGDSLSLVDGIPVPTVFHFGAINTIFNSDVIDGVSFLPGNFSVRYGRGTGGVVDIETRAPASDRLHAYLDVDIWDTTLFIEGPVSKNWCAAASFRRSYIDAVLRATHLLEKQLQFTVAPRYYDFQVKADYTPSARHRISLLFFGSDDKVAFGDGILADSGYLSREIYTRTYFYMAGVTWQYRLFGHLTHTTWLRTGFSVLNSNRTASTTQRRSVPIHLRDELEARLHPNIRLRLGVDIGGGRHRLSTRQKFERHEFVQTEIETHPGVYVELETTPVPRATITYGVRFDHDSLSRNNDVDPRVNIRYRPLDDTTFKAGLGLFHQSPEIQYSLAEGSRLKSMAAIHYHLGVNQVLPFYRLLSLELGGFYKDMRRITFSHHGGGNVAGLEAMIQHRPNRHFFGWISYTLMKSRRFLYSAPTRIPFDFDQTHLLTLVTGVMLEHEIGLGVRFRLASGFPYTPIAGYRFFDDWSAMKIPVWGESNSARMPLFHQLDLRIDKTFEISPVLLKIYLDVQNVYNRHNAVLYIYNDSYTQKKTIYDLPILPSIGLKVSY